MMGRACLGSIVLVVMTAIAIIVLGSINYAAGETNEDENHPIEMPFIHPNLLVYTSTESTVKDFEKEQRNFTHQDSTSFEMTDSEREVEKTDSETSEATQLPSTGINFDSVTEKIHHSKPDVPHETVNKCSQPNKRSTQKSERELRQDIFRNYDKGARPVKRPLNNVKVNITLRPLILISASEKEIVLDTFMNMYWTDDYLQWDPCEYGGITELLVPVTDIWKPDIGITTATPDTSVFPVLLTQANIQNCGEVGWFPQFTIKSKCTSLSKNTSDSTISCNFLLGSWTYANRLVKIEGNFGEVSTYCFDNNFNPDWELVRIFAYEETFIDGPNLHSSINYKVTLKSRKHH